MSEDFYKGRRVLYQYQPTAEEEAAAIEEINAGQLKAYIERIESANERLDEAKQDVKEIYGETKALGFDVKILRQVIKLRQMDRDARTEMETILDLYMSALG